MIGLWRGAAAMLALVAPNTTPAWESGLRVHGGTAAWLAQPRPDSGRRVLVVRHRGRTRAVTAAPATPWTPFDLGTDADGRVVLVYAACDRIDAVRCTLHRVAPDGTGHRRLPGLGTAPTLSRGRLTFARAAAVVERPLDAPASRPSRRVARLRGVQWLERAGPWLTSLTVDESGADDVGFGTLRLRVHDLRTGRARRVAITVVGLGGQDYVGASFAGDHLGWAFTAAGDAAGCSGRCGTWRYDLRTGRTERAPGPSTRDGFALADGGRAVVADRGRVRFLPPQRFTPAAP